MTLCLWPEKTHHEAADRGPGRPPDALAAGAFRRPLGGPSLAATLAVIAVLRTSLAVAGFARTWAWVRRRAERAGHGHGGDVRRVISATEYAVARGAALYPGRADCLERSLALHWFLRRRGVPVHFHLGVRTYPFGAHAWVEWAGEVVNDVPEHVGQFTSIEGVVP